MIALALAAALATASPAVTALRPIPLHSGVNLAHGFSPDGRDGMIVVGTPNVEIADQSHTDFFVLIRGPKPGDDWTVVRTLSVRRPDGSREDEVTDLLRDDPHTGEDQITSVRFAHGRVDGEPPTLMIRAQRDAVLPIPDPSRVTVDVYRLVISQDFGEALFQPVSHARSKTCFDNSDAALKVMMGLPTPVGFGGPAQAKPCP